MSISVVIPTYNRAQIILPSIMSVLEQTLSPLEVIIVDDHSTDNTREVVESIGDERVKYVLNTRAKGANGARNTGILLARGEFIAFQDSDDLWLPEKLEKQLDYMDKNSSVDMNFCSLKFTNISRGKVPKRKVQPEELFSLLKRGNFISTQTIFIKKSIAEQSLFDENLKRFQDWDFCLRIAKNHLVHHLDEVLVNVEVQNDSISKKVNEIEALQQFFGKYPELTEANAVNKSLHYKVLYHTAQSGSKGFLIKYIFFKYIDKIFNRRKKL